MSLPQVNTSYDFSSSSSPFQLFSFTGSGQTYTHAVLGINMSLPATLLCRHYTLTPPNDMIEEAETFHLRPGLRNCPVAR